MVVHIGISFGINEALAFNSEKDETFNIKCEEAKPNEIDRIYSIFKSLLTQTDEEFGCICFCLESSFGNKIRNEIIKQGIEFGFEKIEIIDRGTVLYLNAVSQSGHKPKDGDVIWIFNGNICHIWQKINQKANYVFTSYVGFDTTEKYQRILHRSKLHKNPNLILFMNTITFDEDLVHEVFPDCAVANYKFQSPAMAALIKARIMADDLDVQDFNANTILFKSIDVSINEKHVIQFKERQSLPLTEFVTLKPVENVITVCDETVEHKFEEDQYSTVTITINLSGIYSLVFTAETQTDKYISTLHEKAKTIFGQINNLASLDEYPENFFLPRNFIPITSGINAIGIDFGNSKCCAAFCKINKKTIESNYGGKLITSSIFDTYSFPSYVTCNEEDEVVLSNVALQELHLLASSIVYDVKKIVGKSFEELTVDKKWPFRLINIETRTQHSNNFHQRVGFRIERDHGYLIKYPEEVAAALLKNLKEKVEEKNGKQINEAVIAIPSTFNKQQKREMRTAANMAGFKIIHFLPEPVAALFGYLSSKRFPTNSNALVFDLGNNSLNLCLCKFKLNEATILYNKTDSTVGGKDCDSVLFKYIKGKLKNEYQIRNWDINSTMKLLVECRKIKHELFERSLFPKECVICTSLFDANQTNYFFIKPTDFETLSASLLEKIRYNLESVISRLNDENNSIDLILYVGGSTLMPMITKLLKEYFPKSKTYWNDLKGTIAIGAAQYAYFINSTMPELFKRYSIPQQIFDCSDNNAYAVGLDLGTTRCCVAVNRNHGMETVSLDNTGERLLPSYISYDEKHEKCGKVVIQRMEHYHEYTVFDVKRFIGKAYADISHDFSWTFRIILSNNVVKVKVNSPDGEIKKHPEDISAVLLKHIKKEAESFQGKELNEVVITIPAAFTIAQKNATYVAAMIAGWKIIHFLPEPIAAGFTYFQNRLISKNTTSLLFDLGGGTLDICIFRIQNNEIEIISKSGYCNLGGRNFDNVIIEHCLKELKLKYNITVSKKKKYKLLIECQKIKEGFSAGVSGQIDVSDFDVSKEGFINIDPTEFKLLARELMFGIRQITESALNDIGYQRNQIDKVLLVGGGSRMPIIKNFLKEYLFPNAEHCCEVHPDETVAIGAAYYSLHLNSS